MSRAQKSFFVVVIGATGSGKTAWIRQQLAGMQPKRLIIWDPKPKSDYAEFGEAYTDQAALAEAAIAAGKGPFRAVYRPGQRMEEFKGKFDWLCRLVYAWKDCVFVAEELAHVTRPGWSPQGWLAVVTLGRDEGLKVFGATQRPALCDKTFLSNHSLIHCGKLGTRSDRVTMADLLDCDQKELALLQPLDWIERKDTGETRRGRLTF